MVQCRGARYVKNRYHKLKVAGLSEEESRPVSWSSHCGYIQQGRLQVTSIHSSNNQPSRYVYSQFQAQITLAIREGRI